jgi:hypothetical protein
VVRCLQAEGVNQRKIHHRLVSRIQMVVTLTYQNHLSFWIKCKKSVIIFYTVLIGSFYS